MDDFIENLPRLEKLATEPTPVEVGVVIDIDRGPTSRKLLPHRLYAEKTRPISTADIRAEQIEQFLDHLEKTGLWAISANRVGLSVRVLNKLKKLDSDFNTMCDDSMALYIDSVEAEVKRRAIEGWEEPVFSQKTGMQMGSIRKYDSKLLELLIKRHKPEYRDKFEGEIKMTGGVIVVPAIAKTVEAWVEDNRTREEQKALPLDKA